MTDVFLAELNATIAAQPVRHTRTSKCRKCGQRWARRLVVKQYCHICRLRKPAASSAARCPVCDRIGYGLCESPRCWRIFHMPGGKRDWDADDVEHEL